MSIFLDTNVLIYAVLDDPAEIGRQRVAEQLLDRHDCVLSVQVLNEFIVQVTKQSRPNRLPFDYAVERASAWRRFPIQELTLGLFDEAVRVSRLGGFSWWDALIVAAARAQGCDTLITEDLQDGRIIDGLRIVNPFLD